MPGSVESFTRSLMSLPYGSNAVKRGPVKSGLAKRKLIARVKPICLRCDRVERSMLVFQLSFFHSCTPFFDYRLNRCGQDRRETIFSPIPFYFNGRWKYSLEQDLFKFTHYSLLYKIIIRVEKRNNPVSILFENKC